MNLRHIECILLALFILLSTFFYFSSFGLGSDRGSVFVTISTFFFSIFTGFFISRQGARFTKLREVIATFDGKLSSIYRAAGTLAADAQVKIGSIIKAHYATMLEKKQWDYHFIHKSSTISAIHHVLQETVGDTKLESLKNQSLGRIMAALSDCQPLRKNMVMLYQERIPAFQWFLIIFFLLMLSLAVAALPSTGDIVQSVLKSAFVVALISIVVILRNLETFKLSEEFIGENSARDVVDIIDAKK